MKSSIYSSDKNIKLEYFNEQDILIVNESAARAEELVSNYYKMSSSQLLDLKYDIKTLIDLNEHEIVYGPFAQVIRYEVKRKGTNLGSLTYDFYKICIQDHAVLSKLSRSPELKLFPFMLYIVVHELIHIVRFCKFLQHFEASSKEKMAEEIRVHERTIEIIQSSPVKGTKEVLQYYYKWCEDHKL
ncbi:Uncharacterized protein dnl_55880 [Desulfonema limicola]|uniref:Uncharacterized protein n=1 Tax=Desulfonema limicola TaxID=45656 RepID=A0A975BD68_9BACT|nr:hypothetical protein [Desulfonema limicola]QTA83192.1 Uncharacterized protein dnl_55880 [Desulfonema limicola]